MFNFKKISHIFLAFSRMYFQTIRGAQVSDCGDWLIITPVKDCRDNLVYFTELKPETKLNEKLQLTQVVDTFEADYEVSHIY